MKSAFGDRRPASVAVLLLALVTALLAACDDAPPDVSGEWRLVSIDSDPIPAVVAQNAADSTVVLAGTLRLESDRQFSMSNFVEFQDDLTADTVGSGLSGVWRRSDDDVVIEYYGALLAVLYYDTLHYEQGRLFNENADHEYIYERADDE